MKNPKIRITKQTLQELLKLLEDKGIKQAYIIFGAKLSPRIVKNIFDGKAEYLTKNQAQKFKWAVKNSARCKKIALETMREHRNRHYAKHEAKNRGVSSVKELFKQAG